MTAERPVRRPRVGAAARLRPARARRRPRRGGRASTPGARGLGRRIASRAATIVSRQRTAAGQRQEPAREDYRQPGGRGPADDREPPHRLRPARRSSGGASPRDTRPAASTRSPRRGRLHPMESARRGSGPRRSRPARASIRDRAGSARRHAAAATRTAARTSRRRSLSTSGIITRMRAPRTAQAARTRPPLRRRGGRLRRERARRRWARPFSRPACPATERPRSATTSRRAGGSGWSGISSRRGAAPWIDPYSFQPLVGAARRLRRAAVRASLLAAYAAFGPVVAWNVLLIVVVMLAGLLAYAWLRALDLPSLPRWSVRLAFELAPYRLAQSGGHLLGWVAVFLPLALLGDRALPRRRRLAASRHAWGALAALAVVSIPLSGQVHLALGAIPFVLAYAAVRRLRRPPRLDCRQAPCWRSAAASS